MDNKTFIELLHMLSQAANSATNGPNDKMCPPSPSDYEHSGPVNEACDVPIHDGSYHPIKNQTGAREEIRGDGVNDPSESLLDCTCGTCDDESGYGGSDLQSISDSLRMVQSTLQKAHTAMKKEYDLMANVHRLLKELDDMEDNYEKMRKDVANKLKKLGVLQ